MRPLSQPTPRTLYVPWLYDWRVDRWECPYTRRWWRLLLVYAEGRAWRALTRSGVWVVAELDLFRNGAFRWTPRGRRIVADKRRWREANRALWPRGGGAQ